MVRSELALPGGILLEGDDPRSTSGVDIEIVEGDASLSGPTRDVGPYRLAGDQLLFEIPDLVRYRCERGRRLVVERAASSSDREVTGYLVATALPALLWMRGDIVLHAAAAVLPGATRAIAIGGKSGSGKSRILDELVMAGASIVADDTICVRRGDTELIVSGLAGGYFLSDIPSDKGAGRAFQTLPAACQLRSARLGCFLMLGARNPSGVSEITPMRGVAALEALLASRHRPRVPTLLERNPALLPDLTRLSTDLPIHSWTRVESSPALGPDEIARLGSYC